MTEIPAAVDFCAACAIRNRAICADLECGSALRIKRERHDCRLDHPELWLRPNANHLPRSKPGTMFANGGSSLGWNLGAAFGAKLAQPDKLVVSLTGDGSYLFGIPSSVYWMSRRYQAPFLTVIYNNQGWNATKNNLLKLYPDGIAKRDDRYWVNFDQPADLAKIAAAAGGAYALSVSDPEKLPEALAASVEMVKSGRSAVVDVKLPQISRQKD